MRIGRANGEGWLRLGEAATKLGVSPNTLRRWSDSGQVACYRSPGGHRRYRRSDIVTHLEAECTRDLPQVTRRPPIEGPDRDARASLLTLARAAAEGVGVSECRVSLPGENGAIRLLSARSEASGGITRPETDGEGPALPTVREVLRTGRPLAIADLASTSLLPREEAETLRRRGDVAILALPISVGGRNQAVLELVDSRASRTFSESSVEFAEFMARQAARLLGDAEDHDRATPAVPGNLLPALAERVRHELHAVACDILRHDPVASTLEPLAAAAEGNAPPILDLRLPTTDLGEVESALASGEPVSIADLESVEAAGTHLVRRDRSGARSVYAIPLRVGPEVAGLLEVFSDRPGWEPDREERALLGAAAATATLALSESHGQVALSRGAADLDVPAPSPSDCAPSMDEEGLVLATLIADLQRRNRDLSLVVEAGLQDTARLSTDEVLHSVAKRLSELTRTPVVDLYAVEGVRCAHS